MSRQAWVEAVNTAQVDGAAFTGTSQATILPAQAKFTLYAGWAEIGKAIRITAAGRITCDSAGPGTAAFDLMFGATEVFSGGAVPLNATADKTNVGWWLQLLLTVRAAGSSANLIGQGLFTSEAVVGSPLPSAGGSGSIVLPYNTAPVVGSNFDSTDAHEIDLQYTQTATGGTPANSLTLHQYILEILN